MYAKKMMCMNRDIDDEASEEEIAQFKRDLILEYENVLEHTIMLIGKDAKITYRKLFRLRKGMIFKMFNKVTK